MATMKYFQQNHDLRGKQYYLDIIWHYLFPFSGEHDN